MKEKINGNKRDSSYGTSNNANDNSEASSATNKILENNLVSDADASEKFRTIETPIVSCQQAFSL